jgi:hypothetical protein
MKMRSRTVRGYKTKPSLLNGLLVWELPVDSYGRGGGCYLSTIFLIRLPPMGQTLFLNVFAFGKDML